MMALKVQVVHVKSSYSGPLAREVRHWSTVGKKMKYSTQPRKFGNHVTVHRPPERPSVRTTAYQCEITQSTGMVTQMQLEVILAGNRIGTGVLKSRDNKRINRDENGKRKLFLYPCCLKY